MTTSRRRSCWGVQGAALGTLELRESGHRAPAWYG